MDDDSGSPLQSADYTALAAFRYGMRKFLRFSKDLLATTADLTVEQYEALLALKAFASGPGMLVGQLSERLQVRQHTTVALTNKLVERGMVTKRRSQTDRRQVYVQLTPAGTEMIERLAILHRNALRRQSSELAEALNYIRKGN